MYQPPGTASQRWQQLYWSMATTHLECPAEEDPLSFSVIYIIYVLIYTYTNINKIFVCIVVSVHGLIINELYMPCLGVRGAQVSSALGP